MECLADNTINLVVSAKNKTKNRQKLPKKLSQYLVQGCVSLRHNFGHLLRRRSKASFWWSSMKRAKFEPEGSGSSSLSKVKLVGDKLLSTPPRQHLVKKALPPREKLASSKLLVLRQSCAVESWKLKAGLVKLLHSSCASAVGKAGLSSSASSVLEGLSRQALKAQFSKVVSEAVKAQLSKLFVESSCLPSCLLGRCWLSSCSPGSCQAVKAQWSKLVSESS